MKFFLILVLIAVVGAFFATYNKMQKLGNEVKRFRGDVMAAMKKRADLVGRLSDIARSYGDHEKLTQLTASENMTQMGSDGAAQLFSGLSMAYPDLKANATYQQLMAQLHEIEGNLQTRRESYNQSVSVYNGYRSSLPQVLFASAIGFPEAAYFHTDENGLEGLPEFKTDDGAILKDNLQRLGARSAELAQVAVDKARQAQARAAASKESQDGPA